MEYPEFAHHERKNSKIMKNLLALIFILGLSSFISNEQTDRTITGTVYNEGQKPLSGVRISIVGTQRNTTTNSNGKYSIVARDQQSVKFELKGYEPQVIQVGSRNRIDVVMYTPIEFKEAEEDMAMEEFSEEVISPNPSHSRKLKASGAVMRSTVQGNGFYMAPQESPELNTEEYDHIKENIFKLSQNAPLSTFSIDVDGASYSNVRRMITNGQKPLADAVRIEEMINYFSYDYKNPTGKQPFSVNSEVSIAPWNPVHKLVHIGIQGKKLDIETKVNSNLVFLIDVSGSMSAANKLPLLKSSMKLLVNNLSENDRVAIVAYAGAAGLVLPSTPVSNKPAIFEALDRLSSGGSTAGGAGIKLAYKVAADNLFKGGNNRVILATDGDFNTGTSSSSEMVRLIEEKRQTGIYLTITGFGMGNYKDGRMEQISNAGNGNYFYIDSFKEATKVFGAEMQANLFTIAKDVKIQVEFNPNLVQAYRLVGYENRKLNDEDFNDDKVDAGELGAGHSVTALYEIIPVGVESTFIKDINPLKYQKIAKPIKTSDELMTVNIRYKPIDSETSLLIGHPINNELIPLNKTSNNFKWSASVAQFGMILRDSDFKQNANLNSTISLATQGRGKDELGYRRDFIEMIKNYGSMNNYQFN